MAAQGSNDVTKDAAAVVAVKTPVTVWLDGQDPGNAMCGTVGMTSSKCARIRLPRAFPKDSLIRVKVRTNSRSLVAKVTAVFQSPDGHPEVAAFSETIGEYLGVAISDPAPAPVAVPSQPLPVPQHDPVRVSGWSIDVIVSGKEKGKPFAQAARAIADSSGSFDLQLPQELAVGAAVEVSRAMDITGDKWHCRVGYCSAKRSEDNLWKYRLTF